MHLHRFGGVIALGIALAGCPASTTLTIDSGAGADAVGPSAWDACAVMADCQLAPSGCCPTCGSPTLADVDAVNVTMTTAHFSEVCPAPTPCPRCATGENPSLVAVCQSMHCAAVDLSMLPSSACTADADCIVRYANCCGCSGTESEVVSVRGDAESAIEQLLCDGGGCAADCVPRPDPSFRAVCSPTTHHCAAERITIGP
jgi:hypothetical protein